MSDRDAYAEGYDAYLDGKPETANPFDLAEDEQNYLAWNDGWNDTAENDPLKEDCDDAE